MVNVFADFKYAIQYEQVNLDANESYRQHAKESINLAKPIYGKRILDLGCGTGISTCEIFDQLNEINVVGLDQSEAFIKMASFKFDKLGYLEDIIKIVKKDHPYPKILREKCDVKDLETHLIEVHNKYKKFKEKMNFYCKDASELLSVQEKPFDYILASQFIHWLRKKDAKPGQPNLDYERIVLQQVRDVLIFGGKFSFNASGADFKFNDSNMNEIHILNHPFYRSFTESLNSQLDLIKKREYTFDNKEINRIMKENGFNIESYKEIIINRNSKTIIETCLVGGHMQMFQKSNIELPIEEREKILEEALNYAFKKSSPNVKPVIETMIHYLVRKI